MDNYKITQHAIDRFLKRTKNIGQGIPKDPESTLRKLIKLAKIEKVNPIHRVKRILSNKGASAIYLTASGWRFVFTEDMLTLMTVERVESTQN